MDELHRTPGLSYFDASLQQSQPMIKMVYWWILDSASAWTLPQQGEVEG